MILLCMQEANLKDSVDTVVSMAINIVNAGFKTRARNHPEVGVVEIIITIVTATGIIILGEIVTMIVIIQIIIVVDLVADVDIVK
jgi:hypothetical protein